MKSPRPRLLTLRRPHRASASARTTTGSWRPLSLCWRRAVPRTSVAPPGNPGRPLRQQLHTHVHLQVAVSQVHTARPVHAATTGTRALQPHVTIANHTRLHLDQRQIHRHTVQQTRERVRHELVTTRERLTLRQPDVITQSLPTFGRVMTTPLVTPASGRSPAPSSQPVAAPRAHIAPAPPARMPRASATRAPVDSALATLAGRAPMTPPLVWLKAPAVDSAPGDAPAGTRSTGIRAVESPAGAPRPASLAAGAVPNTQVQEIAREARRALALDPSFTERLADDVLRKVDKRLRIERERRGL